MKKIALILAAVLMSVTAIAQTDSTTVRRKRVAVVLSGGGAKGKNGSKQPESCLCHIIQVLLC